MPDLHDFDGTSLVVHFVDDSVGPLPDSMPLGFASELLATSRPWISTWSLNSKNDLRAHTSPLDGFAFLRRGGLDEDAIACHTA
jgi:hypothetical protein